MAEYRHSTHAVYDLKYHVIWCARPDPADLPDAGRGDRERGGIAGSHTSAVVGSASSVTAKLAQYIKGRSSTNLQAEFPELRKRYWGQHMWARGYGITKLRRAVTGESKADCGGRVRRGYLWSNSLFPFGIVRIPRKCPVDIESPRHAIQVQRPCAAPRRFARQFGRAPPAGIAQFLWVTGMKLVISIPISNMPS
jgi:putative transposase